MIKYISIFLTVLICSMPTLTLAAESPTCVLVKFSNDTRFQEIDVESVLSELVVEKLLASGKFNLVETKPIDTDIEQLLYNEKAREVANAKLGLSQGNFNALFEGAGFDTKQAETITTAKVGQIVSPVITSKIGSDNNAEYLIQGTIINLGNDTWVDERENVAGFLIGSFMMGLGSLKKSNSLIEVGSETAFKNNKTSAILLQTDLRIINAKTGEVVWSKSFKGYGGEKATGKNAHLTELKVESETLAGLIDFSANDITKSLIAELEAGKLFAK